MARVKRGVTTHARHKKVLDSARGYRGRGKNIFRVAIERVEKGLQYAYRDRRNRKRSKTQDGRVLRRYKRRWVVERLFAWLQNYRRLVTRWERHAENFLGFLRLGCICILLRHF